MKLAIPFIENLVEIGPGEVFSLIIENQNLFRKISESLKKQIDNDTGDIVLSDEKAIVSMSKKAVFIDDFIPFRINSKALLTKISSALEKASVSEKNFMRTAELLNLIENYFDELCLDFPYTIECTKLNISSLIKSVSITLVDDYKNSLEALLDYFNIFTEFNGETLFVLMNMRTFFNDEEMKDFAYNVKLKQFQVLLLESTERERLEGMPKLIIDKDLCEF